MTSVEILGWCATALVIGSFLFKDMLRLRVTNLLATATWAVYGLIKMDGPLIVVNLTVMTIHLVWFYRNMKLWKN